VPRSAAALAANRKASLATNDTDFAKLDRRLSYFGPMTSAVLILSIRQHPKPSSDPSRAPNEISQNFKSSYNGWKIAMMTAARCQYAES
jgi:hypothetical protein